MRRPPSRLAAVAGFALAATLAAGPALAGSTMTLAVDHTVKLSLAGPAGSVVVGNPAVADVTVVDSRSVFVSGRGPGTTDVTVIDPLGRTVFSGDVRVMSESGAHVVVHRGALTRADLSCDPSCTPSAAGAGGGMHGGSDASSSSAFNPAGLMANAVGGAVAGAASGAVGAITGSAHPS